jgi:hypothetical protein
MTRRQDINNIKINRAANLFDRSLENQVPGKDWAADDKIKDLFGSSLRSFSTIFGATLLPIFDSRGIKSASDDVISHPRQVLDPSTPNHHYGVFLEVVANARDVCCHLKP